MELGGLASLTTERGFIGVFLSGQAPRRKTPSLLEAPTKRNNISVHSNPTLTRVWSEMDRDVLGGIRIFS